MQIERHCRPTDILGTCFAIVLFAGAPAEAELPSVLADPPPVEASWVVKDSCENNGYKRFLDHDAADRLYAVGVEAGEVWVFDGEGLRVDSWPHAAPGSVLDFHGLASGANGRVYLLWEYQYNGRVDAYAADGTPLSTWWPVEGVEHVRAIDVDSAGNIFIAGTGTGGSGGVAKLDTDGNTLATWDTNGWVSGGIAAGPDGHVFVWTTDGPEDGLEEYDAAGQLMRHSPLLSELPSPLGMQVSADGIVWCTSYGFQDGISRLFALDRFGNLLIHEKHPPEAPESGWPSSPSIDSQGRLWRTNTQCPTTTLLRHGLAPPATLVLAEYPECDVLVDGVPVTTPIRYDWAPGSVHTLAGIPIQNEDAGERLAFEGWNASTDSTIHLVTANHPVAFRADYRQEYFLDVHVDSGGAVEPPGGWYGDGDVAVLVARPEANFWFTRWYDDGVPVWNEPVHTIEMTEPRARTAEFLRHGYDLSISASDTDPFVNEAAPSGGVRSLTLWVTCLERGISAFEARAAGTLEDLAFIPAPGNLHVDTNGDLMIAVEGCPGPDDAPFPLGRWIVDDQGGDFCLAPTAGNGILGAVDCNLDLPDLWVPRLWDTAEVIGFSSSGAPPCTAGSAGCNGDLPLPPTHAPLTVALPTSLLPPRPNPFRGRTTFSFALESAGRAQVRIYDVAGRPVRTWADDRWPAGANAVTWDGRDAEGRAAAAGVYFVRLEAGAYAETRKVTFLGFR